MHFCWFQKWFAEKIPRTHLLVQSQLGKYQNNVRNLFKNDNKYPRTTLLVSLYVSIVNFEQISSIALVFPLLTLSLVLSLNKWILTGLDVRDSYLHYQSKLNFQRPTVSWELFSDRFINSVLTAYESSIAEYGRVAMNKIFTLGSGITQYVSTKTHSGSIRLQISGLPKSWISWQKCRIIWTNYFYYFSFLVRRHCQGEDYNTA